VGPPGVGKTLLAERLPTIMPSLRAADAIEVSTIHSVAGALTPAQRLVTEPPFCAPQLVVAMAVSPDGRRAFVTGASSSGRAAGGGSEKVAHSAATGRQLWASRYHGPGNGSAPTAVAVSPGGRRVFGSASCWGTGNDYATVAYSAATGRQLWARPCHGPGSAPGTAPTAPPR